MELSKIIEMMQDAAIKNKCKYSLSLSTHDWSNELCMTGYFIEGIGNKNIRHMIINELTDESDLSEFLSSSDAAKNKLDAAIAVRDKLNAEIDAMGGETLICNEVE